MKTPATPPTAGAMPAVAEAAELALPSVVVMMVTSGEAATVCEGVVVSGAPLAVPLSEGAELRLAEAPRDSEALAVCVRVSWMEPLGVLDAVVEAEAPVESEAVAAALAVSVALELDVAVNVAVAVPVLDGVEPVDRLGVTCEVNEALTPTVLLPVPAGVPLAETGVCVPVLLAVGVLLAVPLCEPVLVVLAEAPTVSEPVPVSEMVGVCVPVYEGLGVTEGLGEVLGEELGGMQESSVALPGAPTSLTPPVAMTVKRCHVAPALAFTKELPPPPLAAQ
jgi:hypothetical protein